MRAFKIDNRAAAGHRRLEYCRVAPPFIRQLLGSDIADGDSDMMKPVATAIDDILVHRGVIVFRLDELDVHVSGEKTSPA